MQVESNALVVVAGGGGGSVLDSAPPHTTFRGQDPVLMGLIRGGRAESAFLCPCPGPPLDWIG